MSEEQGAPGSVVIVRNGDETGSMDSFGEIRESTMKKRNKREIRGSTMKKSSLTSSTTF